MRTWPKHHLYKIHEKKRDLQVCLRDEGAGKQFMHLNICTQGFLSNIQMQIAESNRAANGDFFCIQA